MSILQGDCAHGKPIADFCQECEDGFDVSLHHSLRLERRIATLEKRLARVLLRASEIDAWQFRKGRVWSRRRAPSSRGGGR